MICVIKISHGDQPQAIQELDHKIYARPLEAYPAKSQQTAAIMLMIQNNLDDAVAHAFGEHVIAKEVEQAIIQAVKLSRPMLLFGLLVLIKFKQNFDVNLVFFL